MRQFVTKHRRKILATHSVVIVTLLASSAITFNDGRTVLYLDAEKTALQVGETARVAVRLDTEVPINVVGATLAFPPDLVEVVGVDKQRSFIDLWTEDTVIRERAGEIRWSGGTTRKGGVVGTTTVITVALRAKRPGSAELAFTDATVLASDGRGTTVETVTQPLSLAISYPVTPSGSAPSIPQRSYDLSGDGRVNLVDISIFMMRMAQGYDARLDFNGDGKLDLPDLSVLFGNLR